MVFDLLFFWALMFEIAWSVSCLVIVIGSSESLWKMIVDCSLIRWSILYLISWYSISYQMIFYILSADILYIISWYSISYQLIFYRWKLMLLRSKYVPLFTDDNFWIFCTIFASNNIYFTFHAVKEFLEKCKTEFEEKWNHPKHVSYFY